MGFCVLADNLKDKGLSVHEAVGQEDSVSPPSFPYVFGSRFGAVQFQLFPDLTNRQSMLTLEADMFVGDTQRQASPSFDLARDVSTLDPPAMVKCFQPPKGILQRVKPVGMIRMGPDRHLTQFPIPIPRLKARLWVTSSRAGGLSSWSGPHSHKERHMSSRVNSLSPHNT
ncbi:hypothetical protein E2C01_060127 [Portunus trituberculatus]|uniref:Uncharacterized protein n=1 Tax=Portunus trituberculatus TaxID=210409 RepID=A0A5B7HB65_PORTR|nr:hypothetical protein [Portunus trituberculatus]